ncbi:hypothetical protein VB636_01295, partial [Paracoccus sp. APAP_BH8]|uniref:hypothetical protein n=1 Tax=Paracoccus sp. APAP_BH8 TaxID=3110237 RepID=UPI002FD85AF8
MTDKGKCLKNNKNEGENKPPAANAQENHPVSRDSPAEFRRRAFPSKRRPRSKRIAPKIASGHDPQTFSAH